MQKSKEQLEAEMIEKAAAVQDMVANHPGWKYLMEMCDTLLEQERKALDGTKPDGEYYKMLGFLNRYSAFMNIPKFIKDKGIREFFINQGRIRANKAYKNSHLLFSEWIRKGNEIIRKHFEQSSMELKKKEKAQFHEEQLK